MRDSLAGGAGNAGGNTVGTSGAAMETRKRTIVRNLGNRLGLSTRTTMSPDTKIKLAELSELSIGQLAAKYEKLFGEKCRSRN